MRIRQHEICFFVIEGIPARRVQVYDNKGNPLGNNLGLRAELPIKGDIIPYYVKDDEHARYARVEDRVFTYLSDEYGQKHCLVDIFLTPEYIPAEYVGK